METALILYTQADNTPYLVDLYENENISLNYSFNDIKDLKPRGNYSRTFRIPFTETNAKIFGFIQENTFQFSGFNPKRKINASITVDTIPIIDGYVQFKAAYTSNGEVSDLEIVFFGNVVDFFKTIGDADFKNYIGVELQSDYNEDFYYASVATYNATSDVNFTLVDRGQNFVGEIEEPGTRSIYSTDTSIAPSVGELTPMISARYIFDKIFSLSGFQFNDTDSDTLVQQLDKMWVPWSGEAGYTQTIGNPEQAQFKLAAGIDGETVTGSDFNAVTTSNAGTIYVCDLPAMTEVYDYGNNVTSNIYTAPFSGRYQIYGNIRCEIDSDIPDVLRVGIITNDGVNDYLQPYRRPIPFYNPANANNYLNTPLQANAYTSWSSDYGADNYLTQGTTVRLVLYSGSAITGYTGTITFIDTDENRQNVFITNSITKPFYGNPIDWSANAPVMKCSDFISSIFKMFNLVVIPDNINPKLLTLKPIQEYLGEGSTKDWSNKLDISKDITLMSTADSQSQENLWTYKSSTDYINSLYNSQGDRVYGRLLLLDPENDFATKEQKTELMFSPTPLALIKGTDFPIPKFINNTGQYVNAGAKILYKTETELNVNVVDEAVIDTVAATTLNIFSHYTTAIPTIDDEDLNFGQEIPLHPITSTPWKTLYARYWNDYIADIYAPDARILEGFFALEFADIYQFKYNDQIFIKDAYWRILEISDYVVGMQDSVKVKLIKVVSATPDCLLHPAAIVNIDGSVPFLDSNNDPAASTESCCNKYGYFWVDSECYAIIRDGKGSGGKEPSILNDISKPTSDVNNSKNGLIQADNSVVKEGNDRSIVISDTSYLGSNNNGSFVTGDRNYVNDNLGSVTVVGDAAKTINREVTIGSGGSYAGQYQSGIIQLNGFGTWTNSTTSINLLSNGAAITMPNDSVWYIKLMIVASHADGTGIDFGVTAEFNFNLQNSGGISLKNITLVDTYSAGITGDMEVDMNISGSTFNPIVYFKNSSYPVADVNVTAQLIYTQYHYE